MQGRERDKLPRQLERERESPGESAHIIILLLLLLFFPERSGNHGKEGGFESTKVENENSWRRRLKGSIGRNRKSPSLSLLLCFDCALRRISFLRTAQEKKKKKTNVIRYSEKSFAPNH